MTEEMMDTAPSGSGDSTCIDWPDRWNHVRKLLERGGPLAHPEFQESPELLGIMLEHVRVLVIGAGGLGCELLKDLALMGFRQIDVIDMDTIDLSNLNRQFLFRQSDIGKPKAECAARFINQRIPGCNVTPHFKKIQDYGEDFYSNFQIIVCGLDSILARRWINGMLLSFLNYDEDGNVDEDNSQVIYLVDGGTEGFKGNARVIIPGKTACVECTLDLYPPQQNFPMCTLAHTPRLPEHCVEYVRVLLWPQEMPFGDGVMIDGDDPNHIKWIHDKSMARAEEYGIQGVTYRLTQGVVKRIIPAVASTNAAIAAACATEVFKIVSATGNALSNYVVFNDSDGVYTHTFEVEKKDDCFACSQIRHSLQFRGTSKLQEVVDFLSESVRYQMKAPGLTTVVDGASKTLYMQNKIFEERTKPNLKKTLTELGLQDGQEIVVADVTTPSSLVFKLQLTDNED